MQNVQFEERRSTRKCFAGAKCSAQGDKTFKGKPAVKGNKGSGDFGAGPHPAKLPTCGKELKESLSREGNVNNRKLLQTELPCPSKVTELGRFSHTILAFKSKIGERGCGIPVTKESH